MNGRFAGVVAALVSATVVAGTAIAEPPGDPAAWRKVDPENLLQFTIKRQTVLIELRPDFAPKHIAQIRKVTRDGNYDALPFHRVIDDFMAQGGEVSAVYMLPTPYPQIPAEFTFKRKVGAAKVAWVQGQGEQRFGYLDGFIVTGQPDAAGALQNGEAVTYALHCPGIASMARTNEPNSADTQFFLMRQASQALDSQYTVWGRALIGLDVIRGIKAGPAETDGRMSGGTADKLSKAVMVADMPADKQPQVWVMRAESPAFASAIAAASASDPAAACVLPPVPVHVEMPANG
jgi:peptidylprolyl isomerase